MCRGLKDDDWDSEDEGVLPELEDDASSAGEHEGQDEPDQESNEPNTHEDPPMRSAQEILAKNLNDAIKASTGTSIELNLFTDTPGGKCCAISAVEKKVWNLIAIAVDSGACAHVTPANVFSLTTEETQASKDKHKYFDASGGEIANLGCQRVAGQDGQGRSIGFKFDVAGKLTRPLASVWEITSHGNEVVFKNGSGYIKDCKSGAQIPLRSEGKLYFVDVWVEVPESISNSPFARQT